MSDTMQKVRDRDAGSVYEDPFIGEILYAPVVGERIVFFLECEDGSDFATLRTSTVQSVSRLSAERFLAQTRNSVYLITMEART